MYIEELNVLCIRLESLQEALEEVQDIVPDDYPLYTRCGVMSEYVTICLTDVKKEISKLEKEREET